MFCYPAIYKLEAFIRTLSNIYNGVFSSEPCVTLACLEPEKYLEPCQSIELYITLEYLEP